jgi:hypothetical protein
MVPLMVSDPRLCHVLDRLLKLPPPCRENLLTLLETLVTHLSVSRPRSSQEPLSAVLARPERPGASPGGPEEGTRPE